MAKPLLLELQKIASIGSSLRRLKPAAIGATVTGAAGAATTRRREGEKNKDYAKRMATNTGLAAGAGGLAGHFGTKAFRAGVTRVGKEARHTISHASGHAKGVAEDVAKKAKGVVGETAEQAKSVTDHLSGKTEHAIKHLGDRADKAGTNLGTQLKDVATKAGEEFDARNPYSVGKKALGEALDKLPFIGKKK